MNSEIGRTSINERVRMKLWAVSAGRCELCNRILYSDLVFGVDGNFGESAHIHAVSEGGPRHKWGMSSEEKNNIENLMLLCAEHHHLIDTNPKEWGESKLIFAKNAHESRIRMSTELNDSHSCRIVAYFSDIAEQGANYSEKLFKEAVSSFGLLPRQYPIISLHEGLSTRYVADKSYFVHCSEALEQTYANWQRAIHSEESTAVFARAPQSLLIKLGTLLTNQGNTHVFQNHYTGHCWKWTSNDTCPEFIFKETRSSSGSVAFVIDLSDQVLDDRIAAVLGNDVSIFHLTVSNPNREFVNNPKVQDEFVRNFKMGLQEICRRRPPHEEIHVFPVMPSSLAIKAGMTYSEKTDLPLILFEQSSVASGFYETIRIGG